MFPYIYNLFWDQDTFVGTMILIGFIVGLCYVVCKINQSLIDD